MVYEIRVKVYMGTGSNSLEKYYKSKEKAEEVVKSLNEMLNLYYVNEIVCEDEEE